MSKTPTHPDRVAVITVHGTGDTAAEMDGPKWFQRGSAFAQGLLVRLSQHGVQADIIPVMWTGLNSSQAREQGAGKLARAVRAAAKDYGSVHVVGHSHGGNVANEAASMLGWKLGPRGRKNPQLASVTTVGTPFFKSRLGNAESFGGIAFLFITIISILALLAATLVVFVMLPTLHGDLQRYADEFVAMSRAVGENPTPEEIRKYAEAQVAEAKLFRTFLQIMAALLPVSAITLFFVVPLAFTGLWRILRIRRKQNPDAKFFSIWHPNDEAVAFLQRVEELPITPFPRWAIWRDSRTSAIVWGVRAVLAVFVLAIAAAVAAFMKVQVTDAHYEQFGKTFGFDGLALFGGMSTGDLAGFLLVLAILGAPLIFGAAYVLARLILGLGLEMIARGWLNSSIGDVLRGMAFGRDGDARLGNVSTTSHTYGTIPLVLEGETAESMRASAAGAAAALIEKYRWALFTVGPDTNGAVSRLATDAMTWDSLIHTTYFDRQEVVDAIGDYIAKEAKDAAAEKA
jgi:hypothetical protein